MPIKRRLFTITPEMRKAAQDEAYERQLPRLLEQRKRAMEECAAYIKFLEPDHVSRFKCLCCYYTRQTMQRDGFSCTDCDGNGIMDRIQYLNFGRGEPLSAEAQRAELSAIILGIAIPDRYQREYDAHTKKNKKGPRNAPQPRQVATFSR